MTLKSTKPSEEFLTVEQLRQLLQIGRSNAYELVRDELPSYRIGKLVRVRREDVDTWLERKRA